MFHSRRPLPSLGLLRKLKRVGQRKTTLAQGGSRSEAGSTEIISLSQIGCGLSTGLAL